MCDRFKALFAGRENCHGHTEVNADGSKGKAWTHKDAITDSDWKVHLSGSGTDLGACPIRQDNTCVFGAIDLDDKAANHEALEDLVRAHNLPLLVCRSRSGGAHLYVFLDQPTPAPVVIDKLNEWANDLSLENPDGRPIEIFPKQGNMRPEAQGNWISLPYYGGDNTRRFCVVDGKPADLNTFLSTAERLKVDLGSFVSKSSLPIFLGGPPCLASLHADGGLTEGDRNTGLYNVAVFFILSAEDEWVEKLKAYNRDHVHPPLPEDELDGLIRSMSNNTYAYTCQQPPIQDRCRASICTKMKYGVDSSRFKAAGREKPHRTFPEYKGVRKIMSDPPIYEIKVREQPDQSNPNPPWFVIQVTSDQLMNQTRWRRVLLDTAHIVPDRLKGVEYDDFVRDIHSQLSVEAAPEQTTDQGHFEEVAREFFLMHRRAISIDDVLMGMPYLDSKAGRIYFQSSYLFTHFKMRSFNVTKGVVWSRIQDMGGGTVRKRLGKDGLRHQCWYIPAAALESVDGQEWDDRIEEETDF